LSLLELNSGRKGVLFLFVHLLDNKNYGLCYSELAALFVCNAYADRRQNVNWNQPFL